MDLARRTLRENRPLLALSAGLWGLLFAGLAQAQDPQVSRKEPNVMFIVDTSGSMEYLTGTSLGPDGQRLEPVCDPNSDNSSGKSRWIELIEVLGGTIGTYRCESVNRRNPSFAVDFALPSNTPPPDAEYRTPYHRPMSGACAVWPGTVTHSNLFEFDRPSFRNLSTNANCSASFIQAGDGLIDAYTSLMRFGVMLLDPLPNPGTGHTGSPGYTADWASGTTGAFSYFVGSSAAGRPVYCAANRDMEVGVRNGAAPAWEGKMIGFGDPEAGSQAALHAQIKDVVLSSRPYGASPVAGALSDALAYFWDDPSDDPLAPARKYSPRSDRYVMGGCREQHIVLLTDGEPNLDLRTPCAATVNTNGSPADPMDGKCPFQTPVEIIDGLKKGTFQDTNGNPHSGQKVSTHIIGFASPTTNLGVDCETMSDADITSPSGKCATNNGADRQLEICCNLHEMAYYGGDTKTGQRALFADDQNALREGLGKILSALIQGTASATQPVRSPGVGAADESGTKAYRLLTSYTPSEGGEALWHGNIERLRWTCPAGAPVEQAKSTDQGDDFNFNLTKDGAALDARKFITFLGESGHSEQTLRPAIGGANDGLGVQGGTQVLGFGKNIANSVTFAAIAGGKTNANAISACSDLAAGDTASCKNRILEWALGYEPDATGKNDRCKTYANKSCSVIGDVLHSTPIILDRPSAAVADETYEVFANDNSGRPMMAYVSSNDGQLHGFMMSPNRTEDVLSAPNANNEKFSFIPPAVLPLLPSQYPNVRLKLLDAVSVAQDVVAVSASGATASAYPYRLERTLGNAQAADNTWRTILVQSLGEASNGYFAVDVTDVNPTSTAGPRFLWQVTTDSATTPTPIFGKGGTPLIATISVNDSGTRKEVAVAILPGGDSPDSAGACTRLSSSADWGHIPGTYAPRTRVRCYANDSRGRSVTIVRLDSGEILRTFRATMAGAGTISSTRVTLAPIDSPITGVPAAYPDGTGAIADRVFVGDRDGTLYKIDLSKPDPSQWTMKLFFDTLGAHPDKGSRPDVISQPMRTRPVVSIDDKNQVVIVATTGEQALSATDEKQYVWSITESVNSTGSGFEVRPNWFLPLSGTGEHVLGPPRLFNGAVYFATYTPPPSGNAGALACLQGSSSVYGQHYLRPRNAGDIGLGGENALRREGASASLEQLKASDLGLAADTVIFGVNVEYQPQCYEVTTGSGVLVKGAKALVKGATQPRVQLTFQTTNTTTAANAGRNFQTQFETVALAPPKIVSTIESWAAILE